MDKKQEERFLKGEYYAFKMKNKHSHTAELYHKKPMKRMEKIDFIFGDIANAIKELKGQGKNVVLVIKGIAKIV